MDLILHDQVFQSGKVAQRLFEGSMLVITAHDSMLHRFNQVGTFIWQCMEKPVTIEEIGQAIMDHFDLVDENTMYQELYTFLSSLYEKELIIIDKKSSD